jgi:hypothetical protein
MERYELSNPSDPCFFDAEDDKVAMAVCLLVGRGNYPLLRDGENLGGLLLFMDDHAVESCLVKWFGSNLSDFLNDHKGEVRAALMSVVTETKSSLNDIESYAHRLADQL